MIEAEKHILLQRDERRKHLNLSEPCDERGGTSKEFKGLLAHYLGTSIPSGRLILLCHACHNWKCSNVHHLYWGTHKDNITDYLENGGESIYERSIRKYGKEEVDRRRLAGLAKSRGHNAYTQEQIDSYLKVLGEVETSKRGWVSQAAVKLGISHTQVRRFCLKYAQHLVR